MLTLPETPARHGYGQAGMLVLPETPASLRPDTPLPTPHSVVPVARLLCGDPLHDVDLSSAVDASDARIIIAGSLGIHAQLVRLVDLATHELLEDSSPLTGDVQVVRLAVDKVAEDVAEADFVAAAQVQSMTELTHREALTRAAATGLTALPESIRLMTSLQCLDLRGNELTYLPEDFGQLTSLRVLDLTRNQLKSLPTSFGQLSALRFLHLHRNELVALPENFGQLAALQNLYLSRNQLMKLPESFCHLTSLQKLHLKGNRLRCVPTVLRQLLTLQVLDI